MPPSLNSVRQVAGQKGDGSNATTKGTASGNKAGATGTPPKAPSKSASTKGLKRPGQG